MWLVPRLLLGRKEAWGYRARKRAWRWPLALILGQFATLLLLGGFGNLLPLGIIVLVMLAAPMMVGASVGALLGRRKDRRSC